MTKLDDIKINGMTLGQMRDGKPKQQVQVLINQARIDELGALMWDEDISDDLKDALTPYIRERTQTLNAELTQKVEDL